MPITITQPDELARTDTGVAVTFQGNATEGASIELFADNSVDPANPFDLGSAEIDDNGDWNLVHSFSQPGLRTITANAFDEANNAVASATVHIQLLTEPISCSLRTAFMQVGMHTVWRLPGDKPFFFSTGMAIDADGSPHAYNPQNTGLDDIINAKDSNGNFVGVAVSGGQPVVQTENDPAPGFYVSTTALEDGTHSVNSPLRYVDSEVTAYIVLPSQLLSATGSSLGDFAAVYNGNNFNLCFAIVGDIGPRNNLGEASIATANTLSVPSNARTGGIGNGILYVVFPGSRKAFGTNWTHDESTETIEAQASPLFQQWGGLDRAKACFADI